MLVRIFTNLRFRCNLLEVYKAITLTLNTRVLQPRIERPYIYCIRSELAKSTRPKIKLAQYLRTPECLHCNWNYGAILGAKSHFNLISSRCILRYLLAKLTPFPSIAKGEVWQAFWISVTFSFLASLCKLFEDGFECDITF